MKGLLLDTSTHSALLALTQKGQILASKILDGGKKLSSTLFPALDILLKKHELKIKDLSYISVGVGPGSYMGIRTGATIAKTFTFARNLPLVEFLSPLAFLPPGKQGSFAYVGDAKMGQYFLLTGHLEGARVHSLTSPLLLSKEELNPFLRNKNFIVGKDYLEPTPHLPWIAEYAYLQMLDGITTSSSDVSLCYLRD